MTTVVCVVLLAFRFLFLLRIVMSFFPLRTGSPAASVRDLSVLATDPVVLPLRRSLPPFPGVMAGFGAAELILLIVLAVLEAVICG
jgi:uncharacterized protein YggT (Ycf19 family)